jgi:hypothetical protein
MRHLIPLLVILPLSGYCQKDSIAISKPPVKKYDTIFVSNPNRTVKIAFDIGLQAAPVLDIGTKEYAGRVLGCCDIILKALVVNAGPTSLYIRYGEKYYSGTIAYKENLSVDDEVLDFRKQEGLPEPINENRAITNQSPSLEKQVMERRIGILEGKSKDRINTIATIKEKITFKFCDVLQDENFIYFKFMIFNDSKVDYKIELVDFLYRNSKNEREYKQGESLSDNGINSIPPKQSRAIVYVLPKFVITNKWELLVSLREKEGTRRIDVIVPYDKINEAPKFN